MIDRGHYQMHRGWQDHPVFGKKPYDERGAWEWLIANAAHGTMTVAISGEPVELQRGQLCYSVRFLAERWRWSKSRVHRFLQKFAKWDMIQTCAKTGTDSGTGVTLITVCNYNDYQTPLKKAGQQSGQQRDSSGTNKKNENNEKKTTRERASKKAPDSFEPDDTHRFLAKELGVDFAYELGKFRDHEYATPRSDWAAAFRNWLKRAAEFQGGKKPKNTHNGNFWAA